MPFRSKKIEHKILSLFYALFQDLFSRSDRTPPYGGLRRKRRRETRRRHGPGIPPLQTAGPLSRYGFQVSPNPSIACTNAKTYQSD